MLIVCLSCHFGMGLLLQEYLHIIGQEVPRWRFSMIHVYLQWQELIWDLSWVAWGLGTRIQGAWDFQLVICKHIAHFLLTLTLTIQDAYDRGNESSKLISTILFGRFIKLVYLAYSAKSLSFTFMLSLHLLLYAPIKRA